MTTRTDIAITTFQSGYNCAQSVFQAFRDEFDLPEDTGMKIACGFGAGMARTQEICGAVTGGIIVLGLRHGRGIGDDKSAQETTYRHIQDLMDHFAGQHGTVSCKKLLAGCDLMTTTGQQYFKDNDLLHDMCIPCVRTVVTHLDTTGEPLCASEEKAVR